MNNEWNDEVVVDVSESDITVDQAYDATSSNPQSGTAVAQAVAQAGGTVDQQYNASSTNAQSGTAVAGAIAGVKQVPASTSADATKVLTVDSSGVPGWATAASGGATWTYAEATTGSYVSSDERTIYIPLNNSFPVKVGANLFYLYFRAPLKEPPSAADNYIVSVSVGSAEGKIPLYLDGATEVYGRIVIAGNWLSVPENLPRYLVLNGGYRLKFSATGTISGNVYMLK